MNIAYQHAVAPEGFVMRIQRGLSDVDLTTVSAVTFAVRRPDLTLTTWEGVIDAGATAAQITIRHAFEEEDLDQLGRYVVVARLTVPAGTLRSLPSSINVIDPFAAAP